MSDRIGSCAHCTKDVHRGNVVHRGITLYHPECERVAPRGDHSNCGGPVQCAICARADEPEECPCCGAGFASPGPCHGCGAPLERPSPSSGLRIERPDEHYERLQRRLDEKEL